MLAPRWNQTGKTIILSETTDEPLTLAGYCAGAAWGADTSNQEKNFKRGLDCLHSGHGRVLEFPQVYMVLDGWSARVIREFGRHVGGLPTYVQASTRYINYDDFKYFVPPAVQANPGALTAYNECMNKIMDTVQELEETYGIKREDAANLLPLGMETKIIYRTNLRALIDMAKVRKCNRAYHEFRDLFKSIEDALCIYSDEWKYLIEEEHIFKCKCEILKVCEETYGCGKYPKEKPNA